MAVNLSAIVEGLEMVNDETSCFYNIATKKVTFINDFMDDPELTDDIDENDDQYISLPDRYEINDYQIMEGFIASLPAGQERQKLERAIQGRGAFCYFKDTLITVGLEQEWYTFHNQAYQELAKEWCQENHLNYQA